LRQELDRRVINQQRDEPTSRRIQSYCYRGRFAARGKSTTPADWHRRGTLCQPQLSILPSKGSASKFSTTTTSLLLKLGYLARPAQKLVNAFCRFLNPCCNGTELTSEGIANTIAFSSPSA
jgi:hypothetical protein